MAAMKKAIVEKNKVPIIQPWHGQPIPKPAKPLWC